MFTAKNLGLEDISQKLSSDSTNN